MYVPQKDIELDPKYKIRPSNILSQVPWRQPVKIVYIPLEK